MKKYLALFIATIMFISTTYVFADIVSEDLSGDEALLDSPVVYEKDLNNKERKELVIVNDETVASSYRPTGSYQYFYPLAPVMRALGFEVLYEDSTKTITCIKPNISYYFDINKCLVWKIIDGEKEDIIIYTNPFIMDGVAYVPYYFYYHILEESSIFIYNYNESGDTALVFLDLSEETARINASIETYINNFFSLGLKPQEYGTKGNVNYKYTCDDLGLSIKAGAELEGNCYLDLDNNYISCNTVLDYNGIYNIMKLIRYGTIDTDKKISVETIIDGNEMFVNGNLYDEYEDNEWEQVSLPNILDFKLTDKMLMNIITSFTYEKTSEIKAYALAFADSLDALLQCIIFKHEGDTVTVTSSIDENFIKKLIDIIVYRTSDEDSAEEKEKLLKSYLEGTNFKFDSFAIIEEGILTDAKGSGDGTICVTIPQIGLYFTIDFDSQTTFFESLLPIYRNIEEITNIK